MAGHVLVEGLAENAGHGLKCLAYESSANIQGLHGETVSSGLVEDDAGILDGLHECEGIRSAGANVEADSNDV